MKLSDLNAKYLEKRLRELEGIDDHQKRGRQLEDLLGHLFQSSGLICQKDVRSERKEQFDLIIRWGQFIGLLEVKWQENPISITQLQAFQWRLRQRGNITIGIFVSFSGYQPHVLEEAKTQETSLLLLDKSDILAIIQQEIDTTNLFWKKLWDIQSQKISFWHQEKHFDLEDLYPPKLLIPHERRMHLRNTNHLPITTHNKHLKKRVSKVLLFTSMKLDSVSLTCFNFFSESKYFGSVPVLNQLLNLYNNLFGFSDEGSYGISQHTINWTGFGIDSFVSAFKKQKDRYSQIDSSNINDSENLVFFEPMNIKNSFFLVEIYSFLAKEYTVKETPFVNFSPIFAIDDTYTYTSISKRINRMCELGGFEYERKIINPEWKFLNCGMIEVKPQDYIIQTINKKKKVIGAIFENPCNINKKLHTEVLEALPILAYQDLWIGFFKISLNYPLSGTVSLINISSLNYKLIGGTAFITNIEIWID